MMLKCPIYSKMSQSHFIIMEKMGRVYRKTEPRTCPLLTVNYKTLDCFNKDPRYKQLHFGMTEIECKMMGSDATALPASEWSLVANLG